MSASNLLYRPQDGIDGTPYVEIIMARLAKPLRAYQKFDGTVYYCVADWVHGVSGSKSKDRYKAWDDLKAEMAQQRALTDSRLYLSKGEFQSAKGRIVELDAADDEGLYYIFQFIYFENPNDTVKAVREYLAAAGKTLDLMRQEPDSAIDFAIERFKKSGKSDAWIKNRVNGQIKRQQFLDALTFALASMSKKGWEYGVATNSVYRGLWGRTADALYDQLDIKRKIGNLRDNLSSVALSYLSIAEELCAMRLGTQMDLTFDEADGIIRQVSEMIGQQVNQVQQFTGKDMVTGYELLASDDTYYEEKIEELGQSRIDKNGKLLK